MKKQSFSSMKKQLFSSMKSNRSHQFKKLSFSLMYALREAKTRPKSFIPAVLISLGSMILMLNLMIYIQSRQTSDLMYYKTDTQLIMPDLYSDEVERLRSFNEVKSAEAVRNGGGYLCYVALRDEYLKNDTVYAQTGLEIIEKLGLTEREPYSRYYGIYEKHGLRDFSRMSGCFNWRYMELLSQSPMTTPELLFTELLAALMNFAGIALVFGMKIKRGMSEYATMKAMGATSAEMRKINTIEALGITLVSFPLSLGISSATMKLMCTLSRSLYPEYKMNSVLYFDMPLSSIAVLLSLYILSTVAAVVVSFRSAAKKSVTELSKGYTARIPYVEKSSARLVNSCDFRLYGRIEARRNIRNRIPTQILFCLLIMLPMYFFAAVTANRFLPDAVINGTPEGYSRIYTFNSSYSRDERGGKVTRSLIDVVNSIDGCHAVPDGDCFMLFDENNFLLGVPDSYNDKINRARIIIQNDISALEDEMLPFMTCAAPGELYTVGDRIGFSHNGAVTYLTVERAGEDLLGYSSRTGLYTTRIIISDETLTALMGWDEPRYDSATVYGEIGREEELTVLIDRVLGLEGEYINDYDRMTHQRTEYEFYGSAVYIEKQITDVYNAFVELFLLAESIYLFICAGLVIYSVCAYEVGGRKKEFTILRALGLEKGEIKKIAVKKQLGSIVFTSVLSFAILLTAMVLLYDGVEISELKVIMNNTGTHDDILRYLRPIITIIAANLATFLTVLVTFGLCVFRASSGEVERMHKSPIADEVKGE